MGTKSYPRPPAKGSQSAFEGWLARANIQAKEWRDRVLEFPRLWLVLFLVAGSWALAPTKIFDALDPADWTPGSIAPRDLVAPMDFPVADPQTTAEKKARARDEVLPVYDLDSARRQELGTQVTALFAQGRELKSATSATALKDATIRQGFLAAFQGSSSLKLEQADVDLLLNFGFSQDLEERTRGAFDEAFQLGVVANKSLLLENRLRGITLHDLRTDSERRHVDLFDYLGYPEEVRDFLTAEVRRWPGLTSRGRGQLVDFLFRNTEPNLSPNNSQTRARREAAAVAAPAVFTPVRKGQVLVRKGDQIQPFAARAVEEITRRRVAGGRFLPFLGSFLLLCLSALFFWTSLKGERFAGHSRYRRFNEGLIVLIFGILGAKLALLLARGLGETLEATSAHPFESYSLAVPFAVLAMVARLLYTRNISLVLALIYSVMVSLLLPEGGVWLLIYSLGGSLTAIALLDLLQLKQRVGLTRVGAWVGLANGVMILVMTAMGPYGSEETLSHLGLDLLCGFAGGMILAGVASFAVPILESLFCLTTDIKLVELSNTNLPLLRQLAFEAPGSFQHSLMVANLSKAGCEAIGADSVLAYAGALYHDIGKAERPEYFIENQGRGRNPHDKLQPSMSALVIINHVKVGLSMAREANLPQPLRDAIAQHHGTRRINFFYNRAVERAAGEEVREEDYRYPGPKPANRVMAVLMLADGVEAASRTLDEPTDLKIRSVVQKIIEDCLQDGQLDESELTLSDIPKVAEAFQRILTNIYHRRIDYPGFDFNRPQRKAAPVEAEEEPVSRAAKAS